VYPSGVETRDPMLITAKYWPDLARLRDVRGFQDIVTRMGFSRTTQSLPGHHLFRREVQADSPVRWQINRHGPSLRKDKLRFPPLR
jgi:hypothetical protein